MNTLITNDFLQTQDRQELLKIIMSLPYGNHTRLIDAQIKWVGIMEIYNILNLNASSLLDVGCNSSPISIYFKKYKNIDNVYALDMLKDVSQFQHIIDSGCKFICNNIINDNTLKNNTIDVVIDSCAITCDETNSYDSILLKISNLLKIGGYFITVCDTSLSSKSGSFINPQSWISICKKYNLELVDEYKEVTTDLFVCQENYRTYGLLNIVRLVFKKV